MKKDLETLYKLLQVKRLPENKQEFVMATIKRLIYEKTAGCYSNYSSKKQMLLEMCLEGGKHKLNEDTKVEVSNKVDTLLDKLTSGFLKSYYYDNEKVYEGEKISKNSFRWNKW